MYKGVAGEVQLAGAANIEVLGSIPKLITFDMHDPAFGCVMWRVYLPVMTRVVDRNFKLPKKKKYEDETEQDPSE